MRAAVLTALLCATISSLSLFAASESDKPEDETPAPTATLEISVTNLTRSVCLLEKVEIIKGHQVKPPALLKIELDKNMVDNSTYGEVGDQGIDVVMSYVCDTKRITLKSSQTHTYEVFGRPTILGKPDGAWSTSDPGISASFSIEPGKILRKPKPNKIHWLLER